MGKNILKQIITKRQAIQTIASISLFLVISYTQISLWYVVLFGSLLGIIFGKIFCRWMCPVGFFMEILTSLNPSQKAAQTYQYYKLGCPIAWISGLLNRFSLFKIKNNKKTCLSCGKCDNVCYISSLNKKYSLYKENKIAPADAYACSRCLKCVEVCPNNSLKFTVKKIDTAQNPHT